ncbi:uncharacterized protein LOC122665422 [Telopea speciosissima]|uniref:uncharacterized protein LOC122665422 n=1 Tax=Telopea speciosissima TaxID=54955 RepID=UPI001CC75350|nr:uncharacterized protein LOC122665422 [Telopea speciosissima]
MPSHTNLVRKHRIRFASWNIGSLTGKSMELIDVMQRRRINVACIQETRWKGHKAKALDDFKLWYLGNESRRGGVGIVVDKDLKNEVVDVKRFGERILSIKLVLDNEVINIVSVYAPQAGLDESVKIQFWEHMDGLVQGFGKGEKIIIGGDLNGHVGKDRRGYEEVHGEYGVGERNEEGISVLDFAIAFDMCIVNTFFKKREEHLVTYKSGQHASQIDFFLTRRFDRLLYKDCKVIPRESLTAQHRVVVLDMYLGTRQRKKANQVCPKIRWGRLQGVLLESFIDKVTLQGKWDFKGDTNEMWIEMTTYIKKEMSSSRRTTRKLVAQKRLRVESEESSYSSSVPPSSPREDLSSEEPGFDHHLFSSYAIKPL